MNQLHAQPSPLTGRLVLILAAIAQIAGSSLPRVFAWGVDVGERSRALDTAIIPPGWAFAIWGVIFAWSLAFGVYALTPAGGRSEAVRRALLPASVAYLANAAWALYVPIGDIDIISEVIILTGLGASLMAVAGAAGARPLGIADTLLVRAPVGLLAGWLTAATAVGASSVMVKYGVAPTLPLLVALLLGASLFAAWTTRRIGGWFYAAAIVWALGAILSRALDAGTVAIAATAAVGIVLTLIGGLFPARVR